MKKENLKMYEKPKVEVVEIHLNECIAGSAVQVKTGSYDSRYYGTDTSDWNQGWANFN
ncbi:hypothetical protein [Parabacteroides sp. AF18-52]|uniref:hypothetical protein n=1 Tax=Parabacteroides TaxID=375288 RepID=UPI0013159293|nr:hypothetical protein [Parabacteroides sp. AF18-52]